MNDHPAAGDSGTVTDDDHTGGLEAYREQQAAKVAQLRAVGINPYPSSAVEKTPAVEAAALPEESTVTIAGRIMLFRVMGNVAFGRLHDESGDVQFMISKRDLEGGAEPIDESGQTTYKFWTKQLDIGDFIAVSGTRVTTKTGEPTVSATTLTMLTKSIRPLPDKHAGLSDEETLLRKRYLDILLNRDTQEMIYRKARFWAACRAYLTEHGFLEVQTPVLEHTTGGADARPFVTHHNYLDMDVCLRISMGELWQKRLLVGGLERVFEIGRQFRNENQSREHLNDYDQLEFYWAYADYEAGMVFVEELFKRVIGEAFGTLQFQLDRHGVVHDIDLAAPWKRLDYVETVKEMTGVDVLADDTDVILAKADELGVQFEKGGRTRERAMDGLWKQCRRRISGPAFLVDEPLELSPLAKPIEGRPGLVERFHVLVAGSELGNGYSELNDPIDQAARFDHQQSLRDSGDAEAQMADPSFVEALEYGMPPALGFGMSERVFAFFEDKSVRECQIFPLLKPRAHD